MFGMGFGELIMILVIVVVVFGATKLPQLGDGLGRAIKNFKRSVNAHDEIDVTPKSPKSSGRAPQLGDPPPAAGGSDDARDRPDGRA